MWFFHRNMLDGSPDKGDVPARRSWRTLSRLSIAVMVVNFLYLGVVPPEADPAIVRYEPRKSAWTDLIRDSLLRPLDAVFCPQLDWGCRFLRVEHRTLVDKVWNDKVMASLRDGSEDRTKALAAVEGVGLRGRSLRFAVLNESRLSASI